VFIEMRATQLFGGCGCRAWQGKYYYETRICYWAQ